MQGLLAVIRRSIWIVAGTLLVLILGAALLVLSPVLLPWVLWLRWADARRDRAFWEEYTTFLQEMDGKKFFCYTSRKNSRDWVEREVLPHIGDDIEVVFLDGKTPKCSLPQHFVSYTLNHIQNVGFPNVLMVVKGKVVDRSLHDALYETINRDLPVEFFMAEVNSRFQKMREMG